PLRKPSAQDHGPQSPLYNQARDCVKSLPVWHERLARAGRGGAATEMKKLPRTRFFPPQSALPWMPCAPSRSVAHTGMMRTLGSSGGLRSAGGADECHWAQLGTLDSVSASGGDCVAFFVDIQSDVLMIGRACGITPRGLG